MTMARSWLVAGAAALFLLCGAPFLPPPLYMFVSFIAFFVGVNELQNAGSPAAVMSARARPASAPPPRPAVASAASAPVRLPPRQTSNAPLKCPSCGASLKPTARVCAFCGSSVRPTHDLPEPLHLAQLSVGASVQINHPERGWQTYQVRGCLHYTELWQARRGPDVPWTPTGNVFAGFALQPGAFLLNWQERFYLLETRHALTDADIQRQFAGPARQFAQSNQTAQVTFAYAGVTWHMADIGRFAIEWAEGEGLHLRPGAVGRFIHAHANRQALALEDFQSGGSGQDTLWRGWLIAAGDVKF